MPLGSDPLVQTGPQSAAVPAAPGLTVEIAPQQPDAGMPPEANALYDKLTRSEGTNGKFVYYGGEEFKPGKDFPDWSGAEGPQGKTHAAGPVQWQPDTWNGLKPEFEKQYGRSPDFSSIDDQKRMAWLKAGEVYGPTLAADIKSGKVDWSKLGSQWTSLAKPGGGFGQDAVTAAGKWKVAPEAIAQEQAKTGTDVVWMSPEDYLAMTPPVAAGSQRKSLLKSLDQGDEIEDIPSLDVESKDGRAKIVDQDGRNRATVAKENGVDLIPVAVHGVYGGQTPDWLTDMRGATRRFNFLPVPQQKAAAPSRLERFGEGVRDVVGGGAQLLTHALPSSLVGAVNRLNNILADKGVPLARIPEGGVDEMERDREQKIEDERKASGETGTDWWREGGRFVGAIPATAAAVSALPEMASGTANALAQGAVGGAVQGALEPATGAGNFWAQKAGQVGENAALGLGTGGATNAVANLIKPVFRPAADLLMREGVRLTPGQMAGGAARRIEDALGSIPVLGQAVRSGTYRTIVDFNRAAWNRVLAPLGMELPSHVQPGRDAMQYVDDAISRAYDRVIPHLTGSADPEFMADLEPIFQRARSELPPPQRQRLAEIFNNQFISKTYAPKTGEALKGVDTMLGAEARGYRGDPSYDNRKLGSILGDLQAAFRAALTRQNPQYAPALKAANEAYANFVRVGRAAASPGARDGVFSPAQLRVAVRQSDPSLRKLDFARGDALMQDLSDAGEAVLPRVVPDSGTPERLLTERALGALGLGGAAAFEPNALVAGLAASAPYTKLGMNALRSWAVALPKVRNALAQPIRQAIPYVAGGSGALLPPPQPITRQ